MPIIINYESEEEWLSHRRKAVTSSDIAALFGESPYCTEFELWHRKKNDVELEFQDNDRVKWGRRLEHVIAQGLAEDYGWEVKPLKVFMLHSSCPQYGSSFDFEIRKDGKKGLFELKNVDFKEYKQKWITEGDEIEAPVHVELQLQSELEVANSDNPEPYEFGVIGALIGGNKPIVIERQVDREIGKLMCDKVKWFWQSIRENKEPLPDFKRDMEIIKLLYSDATGAEVDLSSNNRFAALIGEYPAFQKAESEAKKAKDACKAEMTMIMGNAALAKCGDSYVSRKTIQKKAYSVAESSYVNMTIKHPKEK